MRQFDWLQAWKNGIAQGTVPCRACGDPAKKIRRRGIREGCYCRACYREVTYGLKPNVTNPRTWKRVRRSG